MILLISIGSFVLLLATKRWGAAVPALLVGNVIYSGMYGQQNLPVMNVTMALGLLGWAAIFLWVFSGHITHVNDRLPRDRARRCVRPFADGMPVILALLALAESRRFRCHNGSTLLPPAF